MIGWIETSNHRLPPPFFGHIRLTLGLGMQDGKFLIERNPKYGGNSTYSSYEVRR